jgi:hypothetical protein
LLQRSRSRPHRCCIPPARSSGALAATSTRAQCPRELRPHIGQTVTACASPLLQPLSKPVGLLLLRASIGERTSAAFGAFIPHAAALLPSQAQEAADRPRQAPLAGAFAVTRRRCLRRSRPHLQAHRQRNSGRPPHWRNASSKWSEANGDDARAETMQVLLARGSYAKKAKAGNAQKRNSRLPSVNEFPRIIVSVGITSILNISVQPSCGLQNCQHCWQLDTIRNPSLWGTHMRTHKDELTELARICLSHTRTAGDLETSTSLFRLALEYSRLANESAAAQIPNLRQSPSSPRRHGG